MKKRLNVLCVVMLSIMIAEVVLSFLFGFSDMAEGFKDGYNDGRSSTMSFSSGLIGLVFVIAISYFGVRSFVTFVKFIGRFCAFDPFQSVVYEGHFGNGLLQ